jgi:hypothetical protein
MVPRRSLRRAVVCECLRRALAVGKTGDQMDIQTTAGSERLKKADKSVRVRLELCAVAFVPKILISKILLRPRVTLIKKLIAVTAL